MSIQGYKSNVENPLLHPFNRETRVKEKSFMNRSIFRSYLYFIDTR